MLQDLHVCAVVHKLLHGLLHGLGGLVVVLRDGDALLDRALVLAERLKLAVGLGNRITRDRGIRIEDIGFAGHHIGCRIGLQLAGEHLDGLLAVGLALLGRLVGVLLLDRTGLHCDLLAAQVRGIDLLRVALLDHPCGASLVVADEVDRVHTLLGDGQRGDAKIVLATDRRDD